MHCANACQNTESARYQTLSMNCILAQRFGSEQDIFVEFVEMVVHCRTKAKRNFRTVWSMNVYQLCPLSIDQNVL